MFVLTKLRVSTNSSKAKKTGQPDSHVVADVTYFPPDTKQYSIRNASGSGRGQHVVKKVLEHETQMVGQWRQSALTEENYKFTMLGEETLNGRRCFILGLEPRRDAKELLKGKAWVDAEDFRVRQVQGEPSKSPSFWIKKLNVTITFSEVQGMWLQTSIRASAEVRMFGRNTLAERDLTYRVGNAMAGNKKSQRRGSAKRISPPSFANFTTKGNRPCRLRQERSRIAAESISRILSATFIAGRSFLLARHY